MDDAIRAANLTCRYGRTEAVAGLTFSVPEGSLFALLGPNGAGKTTTIRMLMNIVRPSERRGDRARGRHAPARTFRVPHDRLRVREPATAVVDDCRPAARLLPSALPDVGRERSAGSWSSEFDLPLHTKISRLSRGMRVKAALVSSLAYRPRLLVLDEPFSGLDPVVRDDLVRGVLELAGEERWSVLISSHDLDEVERLVDAVGFIDAGRLVADGAAGGSARAVSTHRGHHRRAGIGDAPPALPGGRASQTSGRVVRFVETRFAGPESERQIAAAFPGASIEAHPMTLREIFVAVARQQREARR